MLRALRNLIGRHEIVHVRRRVLIPNWTMAGVIPPIRPGEPGYSFDRSPYDATLEAVVDRFATSAQRANILEGLLSYRAALHAIGAVSGFQWLDGSFLEHVEDTEGRPPNDIDVVTFFFLPNGVNQLAFFGAIQPLIDSTQTKLIYSVDAFGQVLGQQMNGARIRQVSYWYSLWSHRRDDTWKGYVQVDLDPTNDALSAQLLAQKRAAGFAP